MAGNNIKGITIDIGGNTQPLNKALSEANKTSRNLQSELKQVDKLLKLDPKNTELLAQKQKLLSEQITNTSSKLDTLKEAEKQVQEQFERGEVSEEQYRALQREIIKTEAELKALKEAADDSTSALDKISEVSSKIGEKSEAAGKAMLPATAGIAAIGVTGVAAFNELDTGYDTIITKTGATGEVLDSLNSSMDAVFSELPTSAENAGIAIGEVNTRFGVTGKVLEDLSKEFIQFAEINETDLNNSIGTTKKIMEAWNIEAEKTPNVLGLITSKAQETGISVDVLMNSALENNSIFKEMGLTFEQSIGLMAEFEKNGVNSTTAIVGLRKAIVNYTKEGLSMEEGLQKSIDSIKNAKTETEALTIAQEIFGTKGAAEMSNAIREGRLSIEDLCASMDEYGTTVADTFNATLDPPDKAAVALNNLKIAGADLGNTILTALTPVLEKVVEKVKIFAQWFTNLSDGSKMAIVSIGGIVAAIGPALIAFGKMATGVSTAISAMQKISTVVSTVKTAISSMNVAQTAQAAITKVVTTAQGLLNAVMNANPVGIVIVAITALVAAFVLLWNKCEGFRNFFIELWENIKTALQVAWEAIKNIASTWAGFFSEVWDSIKDVFSSVGSWFGNTFSAAWTAIKNVFSGWGSFFSGLWDKIKSTFSGLGTSIANAIGGAVKSAINSIINMIQNKINGAIKLINGGIDLINKIPGVKVGKISTLTLPRLATGTVLTKATPVLAGEDGAEAIMPLEKHTEWIDILASRLNIAMNGANGGTRHTMQEINNNLGGINFTIDKFENKSDKDLHQIIGEAMEVAEEYIKRRGGAFA